jgi:trehalose/maltose transport system permease protein
MVTPAEPTAAATLGPSAAHPLRSRVRSAWLFLTPLVVVLLFVAAWPLARTIWFSFTDARLDQLGEHAFIGVDNYLVLAADPQWWRAVWNTVTFTVVSVGAETVLGTVIALTLHATFRGRGLLRAAVLVPWAIPTIVSAKMWAWMYHDQFGVINDLMLRLGLIAEPIAWTADPSLAMTAVILVDVWKTTPFMALLILAALQVVPTEIYEVAKIDGVHPVVVFFRVTLPLIWPALMVAVIFRTLDALRIFDLIYVLTSNSDDTMTMSIYARQHLIDFQDVGYGSAAATLLFMVVAATTVVVLTLGRVRLGEGQRS